MTELTVRAGITAHKKEKVFYDRFFRKQGFFLAISIPFAIYIFIFNYFPLWGWIWSFFKFTPGVKLAKDNFVGMKYYQKLFSDDVFWLALRNTLIISFLQIIVGTIVAIGFAIILNEMRNGILKRFTQTVSYLPHFVSWVVVAGIFISMTKTIGTPGVIYKILFNLHIIPESYNIMMNENLYDMIITTLYIWKETGWTSIIYLAAIMGINQELYEAAYSDGAGRCRRIWHITLPGIRTTIVVLLILSVGWVLQQGLEQRLLFGNVANFDYSEVLGTYIYRWGLQSRNYSLAMAANVFQSFVGFFLVLFANMTAKKLSDTAVF